jgi:hypothetical protein
MIVGYTAGLFSLTRNTTVPTYLMLGLAASYIRVALPVTPAEYRLSQARFRQMILLGAAGYVGLRVFTTVFIQLGS